MPQNYQLTIHVLNLEQLVCKGLAARHPTHNDESSICLRYPWEIPLKLGKCDDVFQSCGASHWRNERNHSDLNKERSSFTICCQQGSVTLPHETMSVDTLPPFLHEMFLSNTKSGKTFCEQSRTYNNILSFTSLGVHFDPKVQGGGTYCFRVQRQLYHNIGSIFPDKPQEEKFAQIFVVGDSDIGEARHCIIHENSKVNTTITIDWQKYLNQFNPYVKLY
ncbi:hypothetical protein O181_094565 [Austropuccinia psidii MF-1]|uniref:Uncharacterized protein n=1 Tax=Austropuccinia psidii MF-1 TaxID=1389203 RepID=A0A9Q3J297_9BASI|nr:hypothetical protein [Austropuccinia psidii MF-1]